MNTEFRRAAIPKEIRSLVAFDRKVFLPSDRFPQSYWKELESYWMLVGGVRVGCCAFAAHVDFQEDIREDRINPPLDGSLYIATTGILPRFQGRGLGRMLKCWEVAYARHHGFTRIVTNVRKRNTPIVKLNRQLDFKVIRTTPHYYSAPADSTVVMELRLS
jgi:ribosomal protein S18 acetylase RimI-like enzyme